MERRLTYSGGRGLRAHSGSAAVCLWYSPAQNTGISFPNGNSLQAGMDRPRGSSGLPSLHGVGAGNCTSACPDVWHQCGTGAG